VAVTVHYVLWQIRNRQVLIKIDANLKMLNFVEMSKYFIFIMQNVSVQIKRVRIGLPFLHQLTGKGGHRLFFRCVLQ
jgi:hypothetical protein